MKLENEFLSMNKFNNDVNILILLFIFSLLSFLININLLLLSIISIDNSLNSSFDMKLFNDKLEFDDYMNIFNQFFSFILNQYYFIKQIFMLKSCDFVTQILL